MAKKAKKTVKNGVGTKRSGASVAERILKFAAEGKTKKQILAAMVKAFPDRDPTGRGARPIR